MSNTKTTSYRGEKHHSAIFTDEKVRELRRLRKEGHTYKFLTAFYNTSINAVW